MSGKGSCNCGGLFFVKSPISAGAGPLARKIIFLNLSTTNPEPAAHTPRSNRLLIRQKPCTHEKAAQTAVDCTDCPEHHCAHRPALAGRRAALCEGSEHWVSGGEFGGFYRDGDVGKRGGVKSTANDSYYSRDKLNSFAPFTFFFLLAKVKIS